MELAHETSAICGGVNKNSGMSVSLYVFLIQVSSKLWGLIFLGVVNSKVNDVCELAIRVE